MQRRDPAEEQTVPRHRHVHTWTAQDDPGHRAQRRDDDECGERVRSSATDDRVREVCRDAIRRAHLCDRQHGDVRRVHGHVRERHDQRPRHQGSRDRACRIMRLVGGVAHHMPASVREEAGDHRRDRAARGERRGRVPTRRHAVADDVRNTEDHDQDDDGELHDREKGLERAALSHAQVVHRGQHHDRRNRRDTHAAVAERHEMADVACEHRGDRGDDPAVHAPEHRPRPEVTHRWRVRLPQEDVHASAARVRRRELGGDERADQRQRAGGRPDQENSGE